MQYFFFHLMPWPYLPDDFERSYDSAWIWLPNALYDPVKGHELYREYINTLAYAEELGFDGVCVNEHHQNAYGLMPSPNLIAAALTQRTSRVRIAVIGNALPLYNPPLRVAEEFAMLDVLSNGRLIAGLVIGRRPGADGLGCADLRRRDRRAGPRRVRAGVLVLHQEPTQGHRPDPARLHLGEVRGRHPQEPEVFPLHAEDVGRHRERRLRHHR